MASVKIILRKEQKSDGLYPLAIRITKDRKSSYIYLDYRIAENQWDKATQRVKKSHPNHVRLNNYLLTKLAEANDQALTVETKKTLVSAKAVREKIKPSTKETFFAQAASFLENLKKSGKYNQYTSDKPRIGHFREFLKGEDIAFSDINPGTIERFITYLKSSYKPKRGKDRISDRTIANHLVTIRSVYAHARKNGVLNKHDSPFGEGGIKIKFPETNKIGLSELDVEKLEKVELLDERHNHARNLWLFSFYFAGMRISDVLRLRWSDFQNYRLHYSMGKNNKAGSLKIPDKAMAIMDQYLAFKENADDLVFPELKGVDFSNEFTLKRSIAFKVSALDKTLRLHVAPKAGIDKPLTMHISRHTFATLAGDKVSIQMLQKLYRHSSVTTTIGYQSNFINKAADDALDSVLGNKHQPTLNH